MTDLEWRDVPGYKGRYRVSDTGLVWSVTSQRMMKLQKDPMGYPWVALSCRGYRRFRVHRLVLRAFVGERPDGLVTRHLDGDKTNNHLWNLVYGTYHENQMDLRAHGGNAMSMKTHCPAGHEYSPSNTYVNQGRRNCRICKAVHVKASRERMRARRRIGASS